MVPVSGFNDAGEIVGILNSTREFFYYHPIDGITVLPFRNTSSNLADINNAGRFVGGRDTRKFKQEAFRSDVGALSVSGIVQDGAITVSEGDPGFLATNSEFSDYVLYLEFRCDPRALELLTTTD